MNAATSELQISEYLFLVSICKHYLCWKGKSGNCLDLSNNDPHYKVTKAYTNRKIRLYINKYTDLDACVSLSLSLSLWCVCVCGDVSFLKIHYITLHLKNMWVCGSPRACDASQLSPLTGLTPPIALPPGMRPPAAGSQLIHSTRKKQWPTKWNNKKGLRREFNPW